MYADLDLDGTLDYMRRRYVVPMARRIDITAATLADCAAGFGWLSFAYLLAGGARAILIATDEPRLRAGQEIARILGVEDRCEIRPAAFQTVKLAPDSVDIFASVETLEHVGRDNVAPSIRSIADAARQMVLITTPNRLFPQVAHDTMLPFAHWLPKRVRSRYAKAFGRERMDAGNHFLTPFDLRPLATKFRPVTAYQTFGSFAEFRAFYPHYLPYGPTVSRTRASPGRWQSLYMRAAGAVFGRWSFAVSPNLMSVWLRR